MKNRRFWAVLLLLVCMLALTGCRCVPSEQLWYIQGFEGKETFVNGVEHTVFYTGVPSVRDPFSGMQDSFVGISFRDDGTVTFQYEGGETLQGTFTYQHDGLKCTEFTVTLESGERFSGSAIEYYYGSFLTFTFRDKTYEFKACGMDAKQYFDQSLTDLCKSLRFWTTETMGDIPISPCTVTVKGDYLVVVPEKEEEAFRLDSSVAVRCFRLDGENRLHKLDAIAEGECFFSSETSYGVSYVTLYYIDPVA